MFLIPLGLAPVELSFKEVVPKNFIITLPEVVFGKANNISLAAVNIKADAVKSTSLLTWGNLFYLGVFVAFTLFLVKLIKTITLIYKNPKTRAGKLNLVHILKSTSAFSFSIIFFLESTMVKKSMCLIVCQ
ncbi:MAG: hypothetical protein ACO3VF_07695 [Tamlana sp.]